MGGWKPVLSLYRSLRRHASTLKYTDKAFYLSRIKSEFVKNRLIEDEQEISKLVKVGAFVGYPWTQFLVSQQNSSTLESGFFLQKGEALLQNNRLR